LGTYELQPGYYIYVGSAWGPGGLAARLNRHLHGSAHKQWHIDYLRQLTQPAAVWLAADKKVECTWAQVFQHHTGINTPIPGFGSSDCRCVTHLFYTNGKTPGDIVLPGNPTFIQI
jgi:Uri superfamily endonuclease